MSKECKYFSDRDYCQLSAFRSFYKIADPSLSKDERFLQAIVKSSDEEFDKADPALFAQWKLDYLRKCKLRKK